MGASSGTPHPIATDDALDAYRRTRDFSVTPEPSGDHAPRQPADRPLFVIQEHHARRLHWDFRLEHDGVADSWAVPKGVPLEPSASRLAVQTEDHPLDSMDFEGEIPQGEYGAGRVVIWDRGTYELEKWTDREVKVVLHGRQVQGRYVLIRTGDRRWLIRRLDPPQDPGPDPPGEPMPTSVVPMKAVSAKEIPRDDERRANEVKWDGARIIAFVRDGQVRLQTRNLLDATADFPEVHGLGAALNDHQVVLDGEIVALDARGRPSFSALQQRGTKRAPVVYMVFDLLYLDGHTTMDLSYVERRRLLDELAIPTGPSWQVPENQIDHGAALMEATRAQGLEGVVSKRLDSTYQPGRRSRDWLKVKNWGRQEFVVAGWTPGEGGRAGHVGSLLLGYYDEEGRLRYAGRVGTGFTTSELARLAELLRPLARDTSPFAPEPPLPPQVGRHARFVEPRLVAEVAFSEWTHTGTIRQPSYQGLRTDKDPTEVGREI